MNRDPRGNIIQQGNIMRIDNGLVEEVSADSPSGFILISYIMPGRTGASSIENIRLNVQERTIILNTFGQNVPLSRIRKGMWVNAVFSAAMTRSIPPQSNAFLIIIQRGFQPSQEITTGTIAYIDSDNRLLYTGNPNNIHQQVRYAVPENTPVVNRNGRPVPFTSLSPGQRVRITHANFQTASIPPQTTAFRIQII